MPRVLRVLVLTASLLVAAPASALATCADGSLQPAPDNLDRVAASTVCLLNAQRATQGLAPLVEQGDLTEASAAFSRRMVAEHFFAHDAPDGTELTDRLEASGYLGRPGSWVVGENIAWGESYLGTPENTVAAWMNSPPHRENILSARYREIGIGIALGVPMSSNAGATYTTDFGRRTFDDLDPQSQAEGTVTTGRTGADGTASAKAKAKAKARAKARSRKRARARRCAVVSAGWSASARPHAPVKRVACGTVRRRR